MGKAECGWNGRIDGFYNVLVLGSIDFLIVIFQLVVVGVDGCVEQHLVLLFIENQIL